MITSYLNAAMNRARIVHLEEDGVYAGTIQGLQGVIASGQSREECVAELRGALEAWLLISLNKGLPVPDMSVATPYN